MDINHNNRFELVSMRSGEVILKDVHFVANLQLQYNINVNCISY